MTHTAYTFREHEELNGLTNEDRGDLTDFAIKVLKHKDGNLMASNYVGVITTRRGTTIEILPKIDLGHEANTDIVETTRQLFLNMLRCWRRFGKTLPESSIRSLKRFPMLEVFVRRFLVDLSALSRNGLARSYVPVEENLSCLRGRIVFREHIRENFHNEARFYVAYDELSINRPANRLIHSSLTKLSSRITNDLNKQTLRELLPVFADVPQSVDFRDDWRKHRIDRSMRHYMRVMGWVRLFLFNHGLATFSGDHANLTMMFPMEQIFEDFVSESFSRYQSEFRVSRQGPKRPMTSIGAQDAFMMMPDLFLENNEDAAFVLDAKWKHIDALSEDPKHGIVQSDLYQLYAYANAYNCKRVALVYPRSRNFCDPLHYRFFDGSDLVCLPFDVKDPEASVLSSIQTLYEIKD